MKFQLNRYLAGAVAAFCISLCGCGGSDEVVDPLSSVPADAVAVARADFRALANEAGCPAEGGRYTLTPALESVLGASDTSTQTLVTLLADLAPETDLSSVYWYVPATGSQPVVTLMATDGDALLARLADTAVASVKIADYNVYTFPGASAVVRDSQLWIARSADLVIDTNDAAARRPFSTDKAKTDALSAEADIVAVISGVQTSIPGLEIPADAFATAKLRCLRGGFNLQVSLTGSDGAPIYVGSDMAAVDPSFASLMPKQTVACLALGALDWHEVYLSIVAALGPNMGDTGRMVLSMLRPYIESIDGTVAVAVAPAAGLQSLGSFDLSSWEVFLSAAMPQDKLDQFTTLISAMASMSDFPCKDNGDGTYTLSLPGGVSLTAGSIDGKFVIANYDLAVSGAQSLVPHLDSRVLALDLDIPYGGDLSRSLGLPWGLSVDAGVGSGMFDATVRLNGINTTPLKALIEGLAK